MNKLNNTSSYPPLRILLLGCGVIGSVYAAQLALAGHIIYVFAHGQREDDVAVNGLRINEVGTDQLETVPVTVLPRIDGRIFDLVVVAVKAEQLESTFPTLHRLGGRPHVLFMGNNPDGHRIMLHDLPGTLQLGFPGVGGTIADGVVTYVRIPQQPTTLESTDSPVGRRVIQALAAHGFGVHIVQSMDGWLAYHAVLIGCIGAALLRTDADPSRLGHNRQLLDLLCRSVEEGFGALRSLGIRGLPRNVAILHTPILRPVARRYWGRLMCSPKSELYFAAHVRHSPEEVQALANWTLQHTRPATSPIQHLQALLENNPKVYR